MDSNYEKLGGNIDIRPPRFLQYNANTAGEQFCDVPRRFSLWDRMSQSKARRGSVEPQPTGFGEVPQQAFFAPSRGAKIASVATLALLAVSVLPGNLLFW